MKKKIVLFMIGVFTLSFFNVYATDGTMPSTNTKPNMVDDSGMGPKGGKDDVRMLPVKIKDLNDHDPRLKNPMIDDDLMKITDKAEMKDNMEQARKEMQDKINALQEDFKAKLEANKALFQKKFGSKASTIIPSREVASGRFSEALNKLSSAKNNLETAIAKLKKAGKDTTSLEAKFAIANTKVLDAITKVEAFNALSNSAGDTAKVKAAATLAKTAIMEAEKALRDVLKDLKNFGRPSDDGIVTIPEGEVPEKTTN